MKQQSFDPAMKAFKKLLEVMAQLRGAEGCPWDKKQTHESLKPCLLEETYEVLAAIDDSGHPAHLQEELGDLLLQVVFHSQIAAESDQFHVEDVIHNLNEKLIRRHPHVFQKEKISDPELAISRWEQIKAQERKQKQVSTSLLSGVPEALPALLRAYRIGSKAARVNFDWPKVEDVWKKAKEEIEELQEAMDHEDQEAIEAEWGDLFFTLAQVARKLKVNPEEALRKSNDKFSKRFIHMEEQLKKAQKELHQVTSEEWNELWAQAKSFTDSV